MPDKLLPRPARLKRYLQVLSSHDATDAEVKPAAYWAGVVGMPASVFRRDMRWVGQQVGRRLGRQGIGYRLADLCMALTTELRIQQDME